MGFFFQFCVLTGLVTVTGSEENFWQLWGERETQVGNHWLSRHYKGCGWVFSSALCIELPMTFNWLSSPLFAQSPWFRAGTWWQFRLELRMRLDSPCRFHAGSSWGQVWFSIFGVCWFSPSPSPRFHAGNCWWDGRSLSWPDCNGSSCLFLVC